jgi:diketogulonate reductase-like aldo/keto reductase
MNSASVRAMIDAAPPPPPPLPKLLYGTAWKEERTEALTSAALVAGFRGIDTANQRKHYFEAAVGKAVRAAIGSGTLTRGELFLQSKFTFRGGQDHRLPYDPQAPVGEQVLQSFESTLQHFATDYLDSFVLHGPSSRGALDQADIEAWRAIESLARSGRTRFIGVSNFTLAQLRELLALAQVAPRFVQNRCYASTGWDREVRTCCAENGVIYQGFSLLTGNRAELAQPAARELASRHGGSVAELVFRFARQLGMLPLTGTSSPEHMRLDLEAVEQSLPERDVALLESIGVRQTR